MRHFKIRACLFLILLPLFPTFASSQNKASAGSAIPAELTVIDPEIRALLNDDNVSCKSLNPSEQVERIKKALQIADKRGLIRDRALVEAVLGFNPHWRGQG